MKPQFKFMLVGCLVLLLVSSVPMLAADLVNMEFQKAPLVEVFQILGQLGGYNVLVDPSVSGEISFSLHNLPVAEALDLVTRTTGYRSKLVGNTLVISSDQRLKTEFGTQDVAFVTTKTIDAQSAQRLVNLMVPNVRTYIDQELSLVVLFGLTSDLEMARKILSQYDQEASSSTPEIHSPVISTQPSKGASLVTHLVPVHYLNGAEVLDLVSQLWPQREFRWEPQSQNLVGVTTLEEWEVVLARLTEKDLPNFILKGLVGSSGNYMALVEYRGTTTLLKANAVFHGWTVSSIQDGLVTFNLNDRSFSVGMGR